MYSIKCGLTKPSSYIMQLRRHLIRLLQRLHITRIDHWATNSGIPNTDRTEITQLCNKMINLP
jgi:hypothetical protein